MKEIYAFIEKSKIHNLSHSEQRQGKPQPLFEEPIDDNATRIHLPDPQEIDLGHDNLRQAIEERRSIRRYSHDTLSQEELSYLLWLTQGVKKIDEKRNVPLRTVPSAGCRHPFETFLSINRVEALNAGLYRFLSSTHQLIDLDTNENFNQLLTDACLGQQQVKTSAVTFVWVAYPYRTYWRYSERSFRYIYMDAGHICQNLHLAAESIQCGVCAIGAFDDDAVDQLMGFNPPENFVVYMASLGRKP